MVHDCWLRLKLVIGENFLKPINCRLELSIENCIHHDVLQYGFRLLNFRAESLQKNVLNDLALGLFLSLLEFQSIIKKFLGFKSLWCRI